MKTEYEAKFLNINEDDIRLKLKTVGANLVHKRRLMKRQTFDLPHIKLADKEYKWVRVRDEGDKITMTLKHLFDEQRIDSVSEINLEIDSFENACEFVEGLALKRTGYQENFRETWDLDGEEITIDTWPGLNPFVEIEADSEQKVKDIAASLGCDYSTAIFGSVDYVYFYQLKIPLEEIAKYKTLTFDNYKEVLKEYLNK